MDDGRNFGVAGGEAANDAGFAAVGVDDVGFRVAEFHFEVATGAGVIPGIDGANQFGEFEEFVTTGAGPFDQAALGAGGGTADQGDLVAALVKTLTGQESVFLRAADDQSCNNVDNFHGSIIAYVGDFCSLAKVLFFGANSVLVWLEFVLLVG